MHFTNPKEGLSFHDWLHFWIAGFFHLLACSMASCRPFAGLLNFFCLFNQTAFFSSACSKTEKFLCPRCQSFSCFRTSLLSINKSFHSRNLADGTVHHSIAQARESTFGSFPAICSTFELVPFLEKSTVHFSNFSFCAIEH